MLQIGSNGDIRPLARECPLWVKSRLFATTLTMSVIGVLADFAVTTFPASAGFFSPYLYALRKMLNAQAGEGLAGAGVRPAFRLAQAVRISFINTFRLSPFWALLHIDFDLPLLRIEKSAYHMRRIFSTKRRCPLWVISGH